MHVCQHYNVFWYDAIKPQAAPLHKGPKLKSKVTIFPNNYESSIKVPALIRMISVFYDAINFLLLISLIFDYVKLNRFSLILY